MSGPLPGLVVPTAAGPVDAVVDVPGSKSIANRALVCAALADGESIIVGSPAGDDTAALVDCLGALGIEIGIQGDQAIVAGGGGALRPGPATLAARLAGTTSRFVTALAALGPGPYVIDGEAPLRARPMAPLHDALTSLGAAVTPLGDPGALPVEVSGPLGGKRVEVRGDVSSQYVTALMLIGPALAGGLRIDLTSPLVSRPYIELTRAVMASFGASAVVGDDTIVVAGGGYRPTTFHVEPDATSAGYPLALAAVCGGTAAVPGVTQSSLQGDASFADLLASMGCVAAWPASGVTLTRDPDRPLVGVDVDMSGMSDLVPTLAVVAALASTPSRIRGVGFIRAKESDRLGDLATELAKAGAVVAVEPDGLRIDPPRTGLHGARLATHHDHRLAMAFGVLGSAVRGIEIDDPGVVSKSWPTYWDMLDTVVDPRSREGRRAAPQPGRPLG